MESSSSSSSSSSSLDKKGSLLLPPFIAKCYEMVDDPVTDSILSWTDSGKSFVISDMSLFQQVLLPKYFKHGNFSSFMRQLNTYGFRKSDPDRWEFENSQFVKGQKHLLNNIGRRKNPKGLGQQNEPEQKKTSVGACVEVGMFGLHQEVEMLKRDKNVLMQELVKCRQQQNSADYRLICLRQSIKKMEKNQQQMLSLLAMAMQTPGFLAQLLQQNENNWRITETRKKRRLPALEQGTEDEEPVASDGQIVRYQPLSNDASKPLLMPISNMDESEQADPSLNAVDDFFGNIDFMSFGQLLQLPMETDLLSSETNDQFILPDCPEDGMLQDLLLASPRPRDTEETEPNTPEDLENAMETESSSQDSEMETTESLDDLAKQMEQLAYGTNNTDEEL